MTIYRIELRSASPLGGGEHRGYRYAPTKKQADDLVRQYNATTYLGAAGRQRAHTEEQGGRHRPAGPLGEPQ